MYCNNETNKKTIQVAAYVEVDEPCRVILSRGARQHERGEALLHHADARDLEERERRLTGAAESRDHLAEREET